MTFMKQWAVSFIFLIMIITILQFVSPEGKFDKYIKLFTSMLVILAIIVPIVQLFKKESFDSVLAKNMVTFDTKQQEFQYSSAQNAADEMVLDNFETKLSANMANALNKKYGLDARVKVSVNKTKDTPDYSQIQNVSISYPQKGGITQEKVKNYIVDFYSVDKGHINIQVQKAGVNQ